MAATYPQVLLADRKTDRINTLQEYEQNGGYQGLRAALQNYQQSDIIRRIDEANLLGRGGIPPGSLCQLMSQHQPKPIPTIPLSASMVVAMIPLCLLMASMWASS